MKHNIVTVDAIDSVGSFRLTTRCLSFSSSFTSIVGRTVLHESLQCLVSPLPATINIWIVAMFKARLTRIFMRARFALSARTPFTSNFAFRSKTRRGIAKRWVTTTHLAIHSNDQEVDFINITSMERARKTSSKILLQFEKFLRSFAAGARPTEYHVGGVIKFFFCKETADVLTWFYFR